MKRRWVPIAVTLTVFAALLTLVGVAVSVMVSDVTAQLSGHRPAPTSSAPAAAVGIPRYDRPSFGDWARVRGNCDTREVILERDSAERAADTDHDGCGDDGMLVDVYTGNLIRTRDAQIDHVLPLRVAWDAGAWNWPTAKRRLFYNDQSNLRAVLGRENERKSDLTPAQMMAPVTPPAWRPSTPAGMCALATIWRATAHRWDLPIPPPDDAALRDMATRCGQ